MPGVSPAPVVLGFASIRGMTGASRTRQGTAQPMGQPLSSDSDRWANFGSTEAWAP